MLKLFEKILIIFEEFGNPKDKIFEKLAELDYPKDLIRFVYLYNDSINTTLLNAFSKMLLIKKTDSSLIDFVSTINKENDYVFYLTSNAILENKNTLRSLVAEKKDIIAPLLTKPGFRFSNFWGDIDKNNFDWNQTYHATVAPFIDEGLNPIKYNTKNSLINPSFFVIADMSFNWNQFIT